VNDLFGAAALPAPAVPDVNLAISIDGFSLVSEGTASADSGSGDIAIAYGDGPNAYTFADGGDSNIAYVFDPFGTGAGSEADAGAYGNSDLAAVFGDGLTFNSATNGDFLYDIMTPAGDLPDSAAATGGFLAELLSLF
jgi:hypothetical protein